MKLKTLTFALILVLMGCKSSHKLSETDYTDLSAGSAIDVSETFPTEIATTLGWGDLSSDTLKGVKEEIRISLTSNIEPNHLFRVYKSKRKVKGASVLYWSKSKVFDVENSHENMNTHLKGKCSEFLETENFGYCIPDNSIDTDWKSMYTMLESNNIWLMPDQDNLEVESAPDSNIWVMTTQVRQENYFRNYSHTNPNKYIGGIEKIDLMNTLSQLQRITISQNEADNYNTYSGITTGLKNAPFILCDESEVWRLGASLEELIRANGYPVEVSENSEEYFYITVSGIVQDEWYGYMSDTGYKRAIQPVELNTLVILSNKECPASMQ